MMMSHSTAVSRIAITLRIGLAVLVTGSCAAMASSGTRAPTGIAWRIATYNIHHARGMDEEVDLERIAGVIRRLDADVVALQEVDEVVARSGGEDQPARLGELLGMHHAFGSFMDYQGGRYGVAVLSRCAIRSVDVVRLTEGNEPRVALAVEVARPDGATLTIVNVHFDWTRDDGFRFTQATEVARYLDGLSGPYALAGDFNDRPGTRTLALFEARAKEADKPPQARFTFPSRNPDREIDFIFVSPPEAWSVSAVEVVSDSLASDHLPVVAEVEMTATPAGSRGEGNTRWACAGT